MVAMSLEDRSRNSLFDLSTEQGNISRNLWEQYANTDLPFLRNTVQRADQLGGSLMDSIRNYASPGRIAREAGMAGQNAARVWDQEKQGLMRTLGRYGMQPGRFGSSLRSLAMGRAAGIAGAQNQARTGILDRDIGNKMGAYNMFRGAQVTNPGMVLGGLHSAQSGLSSISGQMMQERVGNVQADKQEKAGLFGALGTLGGAAIMAAFSDARMKRDIKRIDTLPGDIGLYEFRYKGDPENILYTGVMAQALERKKPHLVHKDDRGMRHVDYGGLIRELIVEADELEFAA